MRDDDPRPRRPKRDREDGSDDDPRPRRRGRDRDDSPAARPARKGRGPLIAVLAGVGLLVLIGAGVGAYLLFAGRSDKSAADKVRPPRGLQTDMFAYVPPAAFSASYVDLELARELGDQESRMAIDGVFPNAARLPDGLRHVCQTRAAGKAPFGQYLLSYAAPVDFPALAKELKLEPLTGNLSRAYVGKFQTNAWVIFQPAPTKLWVSCYSSRNTTRQPGDQELAELMARDPSSCPLSPDLIAGLTEVSGYPNLKFRRYSTAKPPYTHFEGVLFNGQNVREAHTVWRFGSEADAKEWLKRPVPEPVPPDGGKELLDRYRWARGDTVYFFSRVQYKFGSAARQD